MCGACGVLGGGRDWVDRGGDGQGIDYRGGLTRIAERQRRIALANLLLQSVNLTLLESNGALVLRGPTGRHEMVNSLSHVWTAADKLVGERLDILDGNLLAALESR
jgi:hypothetical protein